MIKKLTLQFMSKTIENDYRQEQQLQLKQEFTLFTLQTILFFSAYVLYYFESNTFNGKVLANIFGFMFLIFVIKHVLDSQPNWNEYILPLLQIYFAYIWNLDYIFPADNYGSGSGGYNWFYGFQAFYFHFALLQLGYQIWPQAVVLAGVYVQYITYYPTQTLEYAAMCSTMFLVFVGLIMTKYTNEKTKRNQFLDNREKNKWIKIIDEILEQSIVVIKLDKKQDQLVLQQINLLSQMRLRISNSKELREILRDVMFILNLKMSILKSSSTCKSDQQNLEQHIRVLIKNESQKLIPALEVRSEILQQEYKVKLIQSVVQEQSCVIMIFENNQINQIRQLQEEIQFRERTFIFLFQQLASALTSAKNKMQVIYPLINLQVMRFLVTKQDFQVKIESMKFEVIPKHLKQIFGEKIHLVTEVKQETISINFLFFQILLICLSQLFDQLDFIKLKEKQHNNIHTLKISLFGSMHEYKKNLRNLKQNLILTEDKDATKKIVLKKVISILDDYELNSARKQQLISLILSKIIFWVIFKETKIQLKLKDNIHIRCSFQILI